jgi:hypothetical protein
MHVLPSSHRTRCSNDVTGAANALPKLLSLCNASKPEQVFDFVFAAASWVVRLVLLVLRGCQAVLV